MTSSLPIVRSPRTRLARASAGVWLKRLPLQLCVQAARDATRIPRWPETAVHAMRGSLKKLQSLVRLLPPGPGPAPLQALRAALRQLKAALAPQRDYSVRLALDRKLGRKARPRSARAAAAVAPLGLARALTPRVRALDLAGLGWDELAQRFRKTSHRARQAWKSARSRPSVDSFLDWRKWIKDLHYQSLALHRWLRRRKILRGTHQLVALLGRRLDLDWYAARLTREQRRPSRALVTEVDGRRSRLTRRIFRRAQQLFSHPLPRFEPPVSKRR